MALPTLTPQQRVEALKKAAEARKKRARVKTQLKQREVTLAQVLEQAKKDPTLGKMKVVSLLEALPRIGEKTARNIMDDIGIAHTRRVRGLGDHQRAKLVARVDS